jgi:hypothetical protein
MHDPVWLKALGNLLTTLVAIAVGIRVWQVFPFDFGASAGWALLVRVLLVVGIAGALIGALAWFTALVAPATRHETE